MSPLVSALLGVTTARYSVQVYMYLAQTLVYLTVSLCMIDTTARLLVRCPLDPSARNVFFFFVRAWYFRHGSHHNTETRRQSFGSFSHRMHVRLSREALYCPCHISNVLIVILHVY